MKKLLIFLLILLLVGTPLKCHAADKQELKDYAFGVALNYDISPHLLIAIIETESQFEVRTGNLMQIMPQYQQDRMRKLAITDISNPYQNILLGTDFLHELFETYEDVSVVLTIYNEGLAGYRRAESGYLSNYVTTILNRAEQLEHEYYYGGDDLHG